MVVLLADLSARWKEMLMEHPWVPMWGPSVVWWGFSRVEELVKVLVVCVWASY